MSTKSDPSLLSATELAAEITARRLSPVAVLEAFLARIAAHDGKLHAFVEVYGAEARLAAEAADKAIRSGHAVGPLHGIPIALKDLIEIEGRIVTGGSLLWRQRRSERTATLARHLIAQGLIVLGKTHTVEFAFGGWGTNRHMGTPWNPWDLRVPRTPGGSSSGSGVAVAASLAPWAVGTDTGGSVRLPAAWCGLTGLKTTVGRISTDGILPLSPTLDTPGPITRSAQDAALLYAAMQGENLEDRSPERLRREAMRKRGIRGLRLARMPGAERELVAADVLAAYESALETLARLGAEIVNLSLPFSFSEIATLNGQIMSAEAYSILGSLIDDESLPLDPDVAPRIRAGREIPARDYLSALSNCKRLKGQFAAAFADIDALMTPTTTTPALPLDRVDQTTSPAHFTRFANFLDLCAIAIPNGQSAEGLPISLQIIGHGGAEETVLRIALAYQSVTDWHTRRPPGLN